MKELLAVVAIALSVLVIYTVHQDRVRKAATEAATDAERASAEETGRARSEALRWKKLATATPTPAPTPAPKQLTAVAISRVVEPHLLNLFSALDQQDPTDLVPPLQITKERVLDKRPHAEPRKQAVYDAGIRTLDLMIATAEERTNTLDALLRIGVRPPSSLDGRKTATNSNAFFLQTTVKRWEASKAQRKASIEQALTQLRNAEREWNRAAGEEAPVEDYDVSRLPPVMVKVEPSATPPNSLDRGAYDQRRQPYTWRRSYYDQYNQRSTYYGY